MRIALHIRVQTKLIKYDFTRDYACYIAIDHCKTWYWIYFSLIYRLLRVSKTCFKGVIVSFFSPQSITYVSVNLTVSYLWPFVFCIIGILVQYLRDITLHLNTYSAISNSFSIGYRQVFDKYIISMWNFKALTTL